MVFIVKVLHLDGVTAPFHFPGLEAVSLKRTSYCSVPNIQLSHLHTSRDWENPEGSAPTEEKANSNPAGPSLVSD